MGKKKVISDCSEITKKLLKIGSSQGTDKAFTTFIELMATSLAIEADPVNAEARKKRYQKIIGDLSSNLRNEYFELCALVKEIFAKNADEPIDILGNVFHELNLHNAWHGQFFTPNDVALLMARVLNPTSAGTKNGVFTLNEPTCGSGTMVIAVACTMLYNGEDPSKNLLVQAQDIDIRCVWMAYIQLSLYNIPAVIQHENTLTMEVWGKWYTANYWNIVGGLIKWKLIIAHTLDELKLSDKQDKTEKLRIAALETLQCQIESYKELGYMDRLLAAIAEKKYKFIMEITSKTEMEKMLNPHCPTYNGNEFIPDKYNIPEEELICWSQASLQAPLNSAGFKRYMEVFKSVLPDLYPLIDVGGV